MLIWSSVALIDSRREDLRVALLFWLEDLHDSGIDLEKYGREEFELYEAGLINRLFDSKRYEGDENFRTWCIARFVYGPLPSDWDVVLEEQEPVPGNPARVPGAWIDDDDDDDDEGEDKDGRKEPEIEAS